MISILKSLAWIIRWLAIISGGYDSFLRKYFFKSRYSLKGQCLRCGQCCERLGVHDPEHHCRRRWLKKIIIAYYHYIYDFDFLEHLAEDRVLVFTCPHYDSARHQCDTYRHRPAICRGYPRVPFFEKPALLDGCGYRVGLPKGEGISEDRM